MSDFFKSDTGGSTFDCTTIPDSQGLSLLCECVAMGALVSLSLSRDKGVLGVTLMLGDSKQRDYFRDVDELFDWAGRARDAVLAMTEAGLSPIPLRSGRQRRRTP